MSNEHNHQVNERTYQEVEYLKKNLGPILVAALAEICIRRPSDPIEYLGHWLLRWRYNEELKRKDVQNALEVVRDQQWTEAQNEAAKFSHAQPGAGLPSVKPSAVGSVASSSIAGILGPRATEASTNTIVEQLIVGHLEGALADEPLRPGEGQYHTSQIIHHHGQHPHPHPSAHASQQLQPHEKGPHDIAAEPEQEVFETEFNGPLENENEFYTDEELQGLQTQAEGAVASIQQFLQGSAAGSTHQIRQSVGAATGEPRKTSVGQPPRPSAAAAAGQEPRPPMGQPPRASVGQPPHPAGSTASASAAQGPRKTSVRQKKMSNAANPSVKPSVKSPAGSKAPSVAGSEAVLNEEEEELTQLTPKQIAAKYE